MFWDSPSTDEVEDGIVISESSVSSYTCSVLVAGRVRRSGQALTSLWSTRSRRRRALMISRGCGVCYPLDAL
jgi:hypothetical protein